MATLLPRRVMPDVTIEGATIERHDMTADYGWLIEGRGIVWENAQNTGFGGGYSFPPAGATQVRRIRHIITERIEIVDGPHKGTRLDD